MSDYAFDPELAAVLPNLPALDFTDIEATRIMLREARAARGGFEAPASLTLAAYPIPVAGHSEITVHSFIPRGEKLRPAFLWFHGGGFVIGDALMDAAFNARIAQELDAVVITVEYSLAPEQRFPTQLDEAFAALEWMVASAGSLGVDPTRIAVGGQSAGASIAASLTQYARDKNGPSIAFQALDVPVTDDRLESPSMSAYDDTPYWTRSSAEIGWAAYLGPAAAATAYAAPARSANLANLPSAYIAVCQFDPLRDEGLEYAGRLAQAGVPTEVHLYPGTFHGSTVIARAAVTVRMQDDFVTALARGLGVGLGVDQRVTQ